MAELKVGVFLSDYKGQVSQIIDFNELKEFLKGVGGVSLVEIGDNFCEGEEAERVLKAFKEGGIDRAVVTGSPVKIAEIKISNLLKSGGVNPYLVEVVDLRERCAWPHRRWPQKATEKAKAMLLAAVERVKLAEPIEVSSFPVKNEALIIGGGVAGINAAIDLSDMGFKVHLVEKEPFIGGLAARMVRFFPTDDCALCIQSSTCEFKGVARTSRKCLYRSGFSEIPEIDILTNSKVIKVEGEPGNYTVTIEKKPRYVDEAKCILCGECSKVCPVEVPDPYNENLSKRKSIYINSLNQYPPIYAIDEAACKFYDCAKCVDVCPTEAINLDQEKEEIKLQVGSIIVATGFEEFNPEIIKEYHYGEYKDVITQTELARMLDPFGPTGFPIRPSSGEKARKIVMIQCVGSRDRRYNSYCSGICCMIALKHADMIKEVNPEAEIDICYMDIRTTGRTHEEYYERARDLGVKFFKGRPTEVIRDPESGRLLVTIEDVLSGEVINLDADLVVLSTAFIPSSGTRELAEILGIEIDEDGFFKEYNSKLRPTETKLKGIYICGGAVFPKDVPTTSLHAHSAAVKAAKFMMKGEFTKELKIAAVNSDLCGDCEFCPVVCPYDAITTVEKEDGHVVAQVSEVKCEGCGLCVGTCPLGAIELKNLTEKQILAQIRALSTKFDSSEPIVLAISCAECGFCSIDSSGMAMMEYPPNIRVMEVPCAGIVKINHIFEALNSGADAVMVIGCKLDGCHYEMGSLKASQKVYMTKRLLEAYGIEPERVDMFHMTFIDGNRFVEAAKMMVERVKNLGSIKEIIKMTK